MTMPDNDTRLLAAKGAEVRSIRWKEFFNGSGVLHTKLFVVDGRNAYVGSANYDWRSLSQVKELGVVFYDCERVATDVRKVFEMYWLAANVRQLPPQWPLAVDTEYNQQTPLTVQFQDGSQSRLYFASSPRQFCAPNRTEDLTALLDVINNAQDFILVSVMDYSPSTLYEQSNSYWPVIDDALRTAAFTRKVNVRLLFSLWNYTIPWTLPFIYSLAQLDHIEVRLFKVPDLPNQKQIPYTRVNHSKYMVTEKQVYIGTSNWSADYFLWTAGVSVVWSNEKIVHTLKEIFYRDWSSDYIIRVNRTAPVQETFLKCYNN
jgi:phospholipase D3/4